MLIETHYKSSENLIVYSKNKFDIENNFKLIKVSSKYKTPISISFIDVCDIIDQAGKKNMILYRLRVNKKNVKASKTKYGYFIYINGISELVYFDPVFAVRDIKHIVGGEIDDDFKFKIQQIGLKTEGGIKNIANFKETFSFDLSSSEAQNQNDKVFADAIISTFADIEESNVQSKSKLTRVTSSDIANIRLSRIDDVTKTDFDDFKKIDITKNDEIEDIKKEKIKKLKKLLGLDEIGNTKFEILNKQKIEEDKMSDTLNEEKNEISNYFETNNNKTEREKVSFILRIKKDI